MRLLTIVSNRHVDLAEINASNLACWEWAMWTLLLVRRNGFVLDARPMDHHRLG